MTVCEDVGLWREESTICCMGRCKGKGLLMKEQWQLLGMFLQCIDGEIFLSFVIRGLSELGASQVNLDYVIFNGASCWTLSPFSGSAQGVHS